MIEAPLLPFDANDPDHLEIWVRSARHLAPAIPRLHGTHQLVDVLSMIVSGSLQLWPGEKASCVTEIDVYPRKTACNVFLIGGSGGLAEVKAWAAGGGSLERWAFGEMGCDWITATGREGWSRALGRLRPMGDFMVRVSSPAGGG